MSHLPLVPSEAGYADSNSKEIIEVQKEVDASIAIVRGLGVNILADVWTLGPDHLFHYTGVKLDTLTMPLGAMFVHETPLRWISRACQEMHWMRQHMAGRKGQAVLIVGEKGTAKLSLAQTAHFRSDRKKERFVTAICKTHYQKIRKLTKSGKDMYATNLNYMMCMAQGGTLYFQNVDALCKEGQDLLADAIQSWAYIDSRGKRHDFEGVIICSSHQPLEQMAQNGEFSSRLLKLMRSNVMRIMSLLDVADEVPMMAEIMLKCRAKLEKCATKTFSPEAKEKLLNHNWTRNVRELYMLSCQSAMHSKGNVIEADDLYFGAEYVKPDKKRPMAESEREELMRVLQEVNGNESAAARKLDVDRMTIRNRKKKHGLDPHYGKPGKPGGRERK